MLQGRRMRRPPQVEAWAAGGGYRVTVYREAKSGPGYRKIKEYGEDSGNREGIRSRGCLR